VDRGLRIAFIVVLELPQIGHRVDAKAGAHHGLVTFEGTIGNADTRIKIAKIELPQALCQPFLAI
jgi:hypothetical protein